MDITAKGDDFVNVAIRLRPLTFNDEYTKSCVYQISHDPPVVQVADRSYSFDNIFPVESEQAEIYNETVKPLVEQVVKGYNATVFAYGQTGTGKTYTMGTDPERYGRDTGLISRTLQDILNHNNENQEVSIQISFCEIYNEKVYDLLNSNKAALLIKGFTVHGLSTHTVLNVPEAEQLLFEGGKQRHTGETKQNSNSSRSHAIFTIHCNIKQQNCEIKSKLNLVDLAGSESVKKTGNEGNQLFEGININKGLLCIGQVINALSCNRTHIPYRQSTITTILKDSLNKKNYVTLIACVSQNIEDMHETLQTLEFAQRAKRLKSRPVLNTPKIPGIMVGTCKPTPRSIHTISSRKRLPFRTPAKSVSTTVLPMHSSLASELDHGDFGRHMSINSSVASTINEFPSTISPIVQKCLDAVESSVLEKLENIMKQSVLMTPAKQTTCTFSPLVKKCVEAVESSILDRIESIMKQSIIATPVKPDTPKLSWCEVQNEVTKTVRKEFNELQTTQTFRANDGDRNVSCRMDSQTSEKEVETPTRLMVFNDTSPIDGTDGNKNASALFKIPEILPKRRSRLKTSSPIQNKPTRKSLRLSLKQQRSPYWDGLRRSQRKSVMPIKETMVPVPKPRVKLMQQRSLKVVPIPTPRKITSNVKDSNSRGVLEVLNTGAVSDLLKLHTIGSKSAMKIIQYRKLVGKFNQITDLENMPWRGKAYKRFLEENFL